MSLDAAVPGDRVNTLLAEIGQLRQQLAAAEQASRQGGGRLRLLLDSAVDYAIVATDLDGLVTVWNEGARRTLGWTEAEMLGRSVAAFFTPEDRQAGVPQAEMQAALRDGYGTDERWHQRKDGSRFWASGEVTPLQDEAGAAQGFVKVLRDRTEQRNAVEKQRADAEFLRSVLAASDRCSSKPQMPRCSTERSVLTGFQCARANTVRLSLTLWSPSTRSPVTVSEA